MSDHRSLDRTDTFYVAGHRGLAGSAVWRHLEGLGFAELVGRTSGELDLRDREATFAFFREVRPVNVVMAAARVGGIGANSTFPVEFLSDNVRMQVNVFDAAHEVGVERLLFLGSSCIYPRMAPQPIPESALLTGPLEQTNDAYAIAKITGVLHVQAMRREYGRRWISAMPTNLYGPGDNYDPESSHVLAALIARYEAAARRGDPVVTNWGTGSPLREFLHVDDLASAVVHLLEHYDDDAPVNIGSGDEVSIGELAVMVAQAVGYAGGVDWDTSRPDGTPRKALDSSVLAGLGWQATTRLEEGIASTVRAYRATLV